MDTTRDDVLKATVADPGKLSGANGYGAGYGGPPKPTPRQLPIRK